MDEQHTPKLYSRFFAELMAKLFSSGGSSSTRSKSAVGAERKKNEQPQQQNQNQNQNRCNADVMADGSTPTTDSAAVHHQLEAEWNEQHGPQMESQSESNTQRQSGDVRYFSEQAHAVEVERAHQYAYPPQVVNEAVFSSGQQHAQAQSQSQPPQYQYQEEANIYPATIGTGLGTLPLRNVNANANVNVNINVNADVYMTDDTMSLPALTTEEYILSMQAINNPRWWENVMMPGFSWPVYPNASVNANTNASPVAATGASSVLDVPDATEQLHGNNGYALAPASAQPVVVGSYQYQQQQVRYDSSVEQTFPGQEISLTRDGHADVDATSGGGGGEQQQIYYDATRQQQYPSAVDLVETYHPNGSSSGAYQFVGQNSY